MAAAFLLGATAACAPTSEPAPTLSAVMPASAYNDAPVALTLEGDNFRPTYQVDARTGSATLDTHGFRVWMTRSKVSGADRVDLTDVLWQSLQLVAAELPAGTPSGPYDVTVADPRGRTWTQPYAFQSLGPDMTPPQVRIVSPPGSASFAVGAVVPIVVTADDGAGAAVTGLTAVMWSGSGARQPFTCPVTGQSSVTCAFSLTAPGAASTPDELIIEVTATDAAGQVGDTRAQFDLVRAPAFNSLSPTAGSTLGQTQVFIEGAGLMQRNVDVRFDDIPASIVGLGPNTLQVSTPAHPTPGPVSVSVTIAGVTVRKDNAFTYVTPPLVRNVVPASGPASGGFPVTIVGDNFLPQTTQIYFGNAPLRCPRYNSSNRIDGIAPAGAGTQAVIADDSVSGIYMGRMVPFRYYAVDAGVDSLDGGPDGGAEAGTVASDVSADDAGCPGAP